LTAAQYEQIDALEKAGKAEEAAGLYLDAFNARTAEAAKGAGLLSKAWRGAGEVLGWLGDRLASIGRDSSVDRQLEIAKGRLADLQKANDSKGVFGLSGRFSAQVEDQKRIIASLEQSKALGERVASLTADSSKRQTDAIEASGVVKRINEETDKRSKATIEIEKYTVAVQKMRAANDPAAPSARAGS